MVRNRLKKSKLSKKTQAKVIETCVESSLLFDSNIRPWNKGEIKLLQRFMDKAYRYVWMRRNKGPGLIQMEEANINMFGVRKQLGVKSIECKIEERTLRRIGHVLRMPNTRLTKKVVLNN